MSSDGAILTLVEDGNMNIYWECSECGGRSSVTKAIEEDRECRRCGAYVSEFLDELNEGFD